MRLPVPSSLTITPRDIEILKLVYDFDRCSREHVLRRFFGKRGVLQAGPQSACHRRVAKLIKAGYLTGGLADRLPSLTGVGSGKILLGIGARGRLLLAELLGLSRSELNRLRQIQSPVAAAHHVAICDVRLSLLLASERLPGVELEEWVSERELRTPPITRVRDPLPGQPGQKATLIPLVADGAFILQLQAGAIQPHLLEVDMATIPSKRMRQKLRAYLVQASEDDRPILWVVPTIKRAREVTAWALAEASSLEGADPTIFWVAIRSHLSADSILDCPVWQVVGGPEATSLLPAGLTQPPSPPSLPPVGQLHFGKGRDL